MTRNNYKFKNKIKKYLQSCFILLKKKLCKKKKILIFRQILSDIKLKTKKKTMS